MISVTNAGAGSPQTLFTWSGGITRWHNLRLWVQHSSGTGGAVVELLVNGNPIPDRDGSVQAIVSPGGEETCSVDALLDDGDVVQYQVQGPDLVNLAFSATALSEDV